MIIIVLHYSSSTIFGYGTCLVDPRQFPRHTALVDAATFMIIQNNLGNQNKNI